MGAFNKDFRCFYEMFCFYFAKLCGFVSILRWNASFFVVKLCVNVFVVISFLNNCA